MAFAITDERREQVERLAGFGLTHEQIGACLGCSADTVERKFKAELSAGSARALAAVAGNLHRIAMGDGREAVTAAIFILKVRGRWKEPPVAAVELNVSNAVAVSPRTDNEIAAFKARWEAVSV